MTPEWRPAPAELAAFYAISDDGRVIRTAPGRGTRPGRELKQFLRRGYPKISISIPRSRHVSIHRLVALSFIGPPPTPEHEVNHLDRNRSNNLVSNLEWVTRSANALHAYANGAHHVRGMQMPAAKLTDELVLHIRQSAEGNRTIARRLGVHHGVIGNIRLGKAWRHVT